MTESLSRSLEVFFSNNINIETRIDSLFNDFREKCIIFFLFFSLDNNDRLSLQTIYNILDFFLLNYGFSKNSLWKPVFKAFKLFFFFVVIIFGHHLKKKRKKVKSDIYIWCIYQVL